MHANAFLAADDDDDDDEAADADAAAENMAATDVPSSMANMEARWPLLPLFGAIVGGAAGLWLLPLTHSVKAAAKADDDDDDDEHDVVSGGGADAGDGMA